MRKYRQLWRRRFSVRRGRDRYDAIFGDDYETVAPNFKFFAEEAARDFSFAQTIGSLRELVVRIVAQRRRENRMSTDSLGVIMQVRDRDSGEAMPDAQLAREILNLVVAGHETTARLHVRLR
jgi:cytochrome P450